MTRGSNKRCSFLTRAHRLLLLLLQELGRRLKSTNPVVAEIFTLMSRDEARHAGFLNKAMSDFNLVRGCPASPLVGHVSCSAPAAVLQCQLLYSVRQQIDAGVLNKAMSDFNLVRVEHGSRQLLAKHQQLVLRVLRERQRNGAGGSNATAEPTQWTTAG